jgi:hypothetical protein
MFKLVLKCAGIVLAAAMLSGCATTTIQSRKQERYAAYSALSPEMRDAVDRGTIKVGMPMDAVYIAWGSPSQTTSGGNANGEVTTWLYDASYLATSTYIGWRRTYYAYTPINYVRAQVDFANGIVKQWHTFAAPPY